MGLHKLNISNNVISLDGFEIQGCTGFSFIQRDPDQVELTIHLVASTATQPSLENTIVTAIAEGINKALESVGSAELQKIAVFIGDENVNELIRIQKKRQ